MPKYAATWTRTIGTAVTVGVWFATNATQARRFSVYEISVGYTTSVDAMIRATVTRTTAVGTEGTGVVPTPLDPADAASLSDTGQAHSAEPTYSGTDLLVRTHHQRNGFAWVAAPGRGLVVAATNSAGLGLRTPTISTGTPVIYAHVFAEE